MNLIEEGESEIPIFLGFQNMVWNSNKCFHKHSIPRLPYWSKFQSVIQSMGSDWSFEELWASSENVLIVCRLCNCRSLCQSVYAVVGRGKPVFVVSGKLKWDTRFHFLPHFLFALAQLRDFGLRSPKKTKHQAQNHIQQQT